jgi:hypothetical protein
MDTENHNVRPASIHDRICRARSLEGSRGEALRRDANVQRLMKRLDANLGASFQAMIDAGIVSACKRCDEEEGGSCCGAGIENHYNETLLLLNLLFGIDLPSERRFENSCFFLGERGCGLKVRHVLCVNYLCQAIQKSLDPADRQRLQEAVGEELNTVFWLHEAALSVLRREGGLNK